MCFKALCCKGPPPPRPEYDLVCIGLTGSGKTSLLSQLCSESPENIVSTTGFSIKAVPFQNAVLNVKELGGILLLVVEGGACLYHSSYLLELLIQPGADTIRKYWSRYYQGSQGVIFVLDSASSEDDLETARNELHSALQHPQLCTLPFLILANHQDKPAARSVQESRPPSNFWHSLFIRHRRSALHFPGGNRSKPYLLCGLNKSLERDWTSQIKKYFELEPLARGKRWILKPCSLDDMEAVKDSFTLLINLLEERELEPSRM
ncbi:ADP-ribosylation factor-like protein 15 isoform X2 [Lepidochelys kempii]|uniref:ADP-ribosylation factor-like protein 15 isoform X2 n=1 Tax=Lepidochelys kempii TaxID=8472 RepID=UPI003C7026E6